MTRRLLLLNGLAILAVVSNHAVHTGPLAMFWWTFRYNPGASVPNYDQFGSVTYYALIAIMKLSLFAVPSFLFVSGYFVSFITRGQESKLSWKWVRVTIVRLLVPYLIWSLASFFTTWLQSCLDVCTVNSLGEYIIMLLTGRAQNAYWYVVLICQFYLVSPLLVVLAKTRLKLLLLIAALTHVCSLLVVYLAFFIDVPDIAHAVFFGSLFPRDLIYFVFGIAAGYHLPRLQQWLAKYKWLLLSILFISAILSLVESEIFYRISEGGYDYLSHYIGGPMTIPMTVYIFTFILSFLAFDISSFPLSRTLYQLGPRSYGIYLIHPIVIQITPKVIYHLTPWLLAYQFLYQPVLILIGLGVPMLLMTIVAKSRFQGSYRYLFG